MLQRARNDPTKSAYKVLEGPHDFKRQPWAPPGCRAVIHEPANTRAYWAPRAIDAWYLGPAKEDYRSYNFYVSETRGYRVSNSAEFFPAYSVIPEQSTLH